MCKRLGLLVLAVLALAPETDGEYYLVPRILDTE